MTSSGLVLVLAVAAGVSLLRGLRPGLPLPGPLLELGCGIVLGPTLLALVTLDPLLSAVATLGMSFLLFLAGYEVDVRALRRPAQRPARRGLLGSLALAPVAAATLWLIGWDLRAAALVACALLATSVGLVVPLLRDAGLLHTPLGDLVLTGAALGEIGAIVTVSIGFSATRGPLGALVVLGVMLAVGGAAAWAIGMLARSRRIAVAVRAQADGGGQARVRIAVVAVTAFALLASTLGLETVLGAFVAGGVARFIDPDPERSHPGFSTKLDAIGFGFLIPVFFVASGIRLDLREVLGHPAGLAVVPLVLALLLVVRGLPALTLRPVLGHRRTVVAGLMLATTLPFLLVAGEIGESLQVLTPDQAGALAVAGLISVIAFPTAALVLSRVTAEPRPMQPAERWTGPTR